MVVAPIISQAFAHALERVNATSSVEPDATPASPLEAQQVEIPFVPESLRQSQSITTKLETNDTIIVVGRTRERKRKRVRQQADVIEGDERKNTKKAKDGEVDTDSENGIIGMKTEEFDYASAPNFLDGPVKDPSTLSNPQKGKPTKGISIPHTKNLRVLNCCTFFRASHLCE